MKAGTAGWILTTAVDSPPWKNVRLFSWGVIFGFGLHQGKWNKEGPRVAREQTYTIVL